MSKYKQMIKDKDQHITELEAKLEEIEMQNNTVRNINNWNNATIAMLREKNTKLEDGAMDFVNKIFSLENEKNQIKTQYEEVMKRLFELEEACDRIAELEEEVKQLNNYNEELRKNYERCIDTLKQENAKLQEQLKTRTWEVEELMHERKRLENDYMKLQEQLKNAKPPKFKHHQIVYAVANTDILRGQIEVYDFYEKKYLVHFYGIDDVNCLGDEWCYENGFFATEAEAQKYLEEHK